jgi:hypothetical protein
MSILFNQFFVLIKIINATVYNYKKNKDLQMSVLKK